MAEQINVRYSQQLQEQLFPKSDFYKNSLSETGIAADADTFEIPNLSDIDDAQEGKPTILPLKVVVSEDTKVTGTMKQLYCSPILITDENEITLNYDKRSAKQKQQAATLSSKAGTYAAYQWLPASASSNIVVSTGAARATNVTGFTGNRKALTKADLLKVKAILMKANALEIPGELYALLTPDGYSDLLGIAEFVDYDKTGVASKLEAGILGKILGFNVMVRSAFGKGHIGAWYTAANGKVRAIDTAATDRPANLFWHSGLVCHAEGLAKTYINPDLAEYMGTLISASVRFGAEICRADGIGTAAIVEVV
jgi:hypothetical protein